jgi:hypothetical protein
VHEYITEDIKKGIFEVVNSTKEFLKEMQEEKKKIIDGIVLGSVGDSKISERDQYMSSILSTLKEHFITQKMKYSDEKTHFNLNLYNTRSNFCKELRSFGL